MSLRATGKPGAWQDEFRSFKLPLPQRGAMPVPTIADIEGDGPLEITVKDGEDRVRQLLVYTVPDSADNCLLWPTGRGKSAKRTPRLYKLIHRCTI